MFYFDFINRELFWRLLEILHTGLENFHVLFSDDIFRHAGADALTVTHFSKAAAIRGGDAFDRAVGTVDIPLVVHADAPFRAAVLSRDLSAREQLLDRLLRRDKTALSM